MAAAVMRALAITVSTRAAAGQRVDTSGVLLVDGLALMGFATQGPVVVSDGPAVAEALGEGLSHGYDLIVTTGGTGLSPADQTPEFTAPLLQRLIPGIPEALREHGVRNGVATAILSRGIAGTSGSTLIINLAGSPGAVRDGLEVLVPLVHHALEQMRGVDHS
ncbi:MAG: MogA/MoaB family molybdenum cofactor biosynthesis protein [Candidatus Nanopelagicales bacterium]